MGSTATLAVPITGEVKPFFIVGTCHGLLLLRKNQTHDFCILNPTTNQNVYLKKLLPCSDFLFQATAVYVGFGFGYDCVKDDYKVIRIIQEFNPTKMGLRTEMVISSVTTKALKFVKIPYFIGTKLGYFCDGALHWLMSTYNHIHLSLIVGYDLATGEFRELPLPDLREDVEDLEFEGIVDFSMDVGQLGKWISFCANYGESMGVSIWAMKEYGVEESWTKLFSISLAKLPSAIIKPLGLMENGNLVLLEVEEDNAPLIWYDRKKKGVRTFMQNKNGEAVICLKTIAPVPSIKNGKKGDKNSSSGNPKKTASRDDFLSKGFKLKL